MDRYKKSHIKTINARYQDYFGTNIWITWCIIFFHWKSRFFEYIVKKREKITDNHNILSNKHEKITENH